MEHFLAMTDAKGWDTLNSINTDEISGMLNSASLRNNVLEVRTNTLVRLCSSSGRNSRKTQPTVVWHRGPCDQEKQKCVSSSAASVCG